MTYEKQLSELLKRVPSERLRFYVLPQRLPIHVPFAISKGSNSSSESIFIGVLLDGGTKHFGIGEAAPFGVLTGENFDDCIRVASEIQRAIDGFSFADSLRFLQGEKDQLFKCHRSVYVGFEMALLDLGTKCLGWPLRRLFGGADVRTTVADITLPVMKTNEIGGFWNVFSPWGFQFLKIKTSGNVAWDEEFILEALHVVRPRSFSLDGNQAYRYDDAVFLIKRLAARGLLPEFFEQPLAKQNLSDNRLIEEQTGVPVCLDESAETAADIEDIISSRHAKMINVKIMKSSIAEAARIVELAHRGGLRIMIGGMLETEIAMTCSLHLLAGSGSITYCDLDTPCFFKDRVSEDSPYHAQTALLRCPQTSGIGVNLRADLHAALFGDT